jgi:hypothetical protein
MLEIGPLGQRHRLHRTSSGLVTVDEAAAVGRVPSLFAMLLASCSISLYLL